MEEKFVSEIKQIPHNAERIYGMLSDLSNLERVKDRIPVGKGEPVLDIAVDLLRAMAGAVEAAQDEGRG